MNAQQSLRVQLLQELRFEVIPLRGVEAQVAHLPEGTVVTITCSPRHGIEKSLELAGLFRRAGYRAVPHVAARLVRDRGHLTSIVARLEEIGADEIFLIGGDAAQPAGEFGSALPVLQALSELPHRPLRVGIGAYPDGHPLLDRETLVELLQAKQPYAAYMVTQLCFDARRIGEWLRSVRDRGVDLPVYVGVPGAVDRRRLFEIAVRIGVGASTRFLKKHAGMAQELAVHQRFEPTALVAEVTEALAQGDLGLAGFHLNTFNQVEASRSWQMGELQRLTAVRG